jgi:phytoene dehydrogenase-like protein
MRADWDVIVIGAGLAGLAAGATATRAGFTTLVLDAHVPGGRARVTTSEGFVFNRGVHALYKGGAGWVMAVTSEDGVITSLYFVGNPGKLGSVGQRLTIE